MNLRQKDVLVAERLLDLSVHVVGPPRYEGYGSVGEEELLVVQYGGVFEELPDYASNITDAWRVVRKMRERGWNFTFNWNDDLPEAIFFKGWPIEDNTAIAVRCSTNPATAIVDAALAAEGVEVPTK